MLGMHQQIFWKKEPFLNRSSMHLILVLIVLLIYGWTLSIAYLTGSQTIANNSHYYNYNSNPSS